MDPGLEAHVWILSPPGGRCGQGCARALERERSITYSRRWYTTSIRFRFTISKSGIRSPVSRRRPSGRRRS